ncbi:hypothetical protein MRB53_039710 [Persea americana]|nr:hypothetical protein MRB53_039710 [Persea americana]
MIDLILSRYVAPRSLMLNLQDMLSGDDFKKDTVAEGILVVHIKRGYDFKMGDAAIPLISSGGSDPYVSVGWAKFGRALWSTRVLIKEMEPVWRETAYILVTPEEINVSERLRVQLWDSDRFTADDDLGRIEVDLEELMKSPETNGQLHNRVDGFRNLKAGEEMPGKLEWQVGYFPKVGLQKCQFSKQTYDEEIRSMDDLEAKVIRICEEKLREVKIKKGRHLKAAQEYEQQKLREKKMRQDAMIMSAPPPEDYSSGIFSIQIHQITGMGFHSLHKDPESRYDAEEEKEEGAELPSAYCSILLNHKKIYKTRVKPSNPKPFYNASTEKFVSDWRSAEVYVTVRDSRVDEDDPIMGIVHLPLGEIFQDRTQISGWYPIVGGVGFGRIRLSLVWRSVLLQAPAEALGWDTGTLEVQPTISSTDIADDLRNLNIKCRTNLSKGKFFFSKEEQNWITGGKRSLRLPVHRRYSSNLVIELRRHGRGLRNKVAAFAIMWLRDIPDEETRDLTLTLWKGDLARAKATSLDDCGEAVGHLHVSVKFWSGMGDAHRKWASADNNLRDVMGVLEIARDHYETRETEKQAGISTGEQRGDVEGQGKPNGHDHVDNDQDDYDDDDNDEDDSSDDEHDPTDGSATSKAAVSRSGSDNNNDKGTGDQETHVGLLDSLRDYKKHARQQQRQNRGIMQYKIPRTTQWALHKAERAEQKLSGIFRRHTREPGIETEV